MQAKPNCCSAPVLEVVRSIFTPPGLVRDLRQCRCCGAYWQFDAEERMNFNGGEDHYWEWYTRLTPAEIAALLDEE